MILMLCQGAEEWAKSIGVTPHYCRNVISEKGSFSGTFTSGKLSFLCQKNCWQVACWVLSGRNHHYYPSYLFFSLVSELFFLKLMFLCLVISYTVLHLNFSKSFILHFLTLSFPTTICFSWSVLQNTWIQLRRIHLCQGVKMARSTPWTTQVTTAHQTASPEERMSTWTSPFTSTPFIKPLTWVWKPSEETAFPSLVSLPLLSQPQLQAPTSPSRSRQVYRTTLSPPPSPLRLVCLAIMVHQPTSSTVTTPSNLWDIQEEAPYLRAKQDPTPNPRCVRLVLCPPLPP